MKWWRKFKKGLFTQSQVLTGVTITLFCSSMIVYAFNYISLNVFSPGQVISSAQINQNFAYVKERLDKLGGKEIQLVTTTPQFFPSTAYSVVNTLNFEQIALDLAHNGSAQEMLNYNTLTILETGFYQLTVAGKMEAMNSTSNRINLFHLPVGSTSYSTIYGAYYWSTLDTKGYKEDRWLNSGDKIHVGPKTTDVTNGATFSAGVKFSIKKL